MMLPPGLGPAGPVGAVGLAPPQPETPNAPASTNPAPSRLTLVQPAARLLWRPARAPRPLATDRALRVGVQWSAFSGRPVAARQTL